MAYTKYSLTPANNNAAPPDGAPEGMLPSAVNDTMRDMMAQIRDVGDGIRGGTYTMTAPIITGGTITGSTINNSAIGGTTAAAGKFTTLEATGVTTVQAGTVSAPAITTTGDTNTGIYFPAADTIAFTEGGVEAMRIDSSANIGIGTSSPGAKLSLTSTGNTTADGVRLTFGSEARPHNIYSDLSTGRDLLIAPWRTVTLKSGSGTTEGEVRLQSYESTIISTGSSYTERMRIDSSGILLVGKTSATITTAGAPVYFGALSATRDAEVVATINRLTNDGGLVSFRQDSTEEGTISVSGTTVSYNGGHLSRWSQLPDNSKDDTILKGTVLTNLDDMCVWVKDGEQLPNEQLNKMQVSSVEGDTNVAGVFVNWTRDEDCNSDDMNVAMTGDMIIRIADGVVVQKGDLLMSAGDGTAKPQGDDIVRSKTVAKVTSNYVTCTYADGSYCVPCVLMAC
jgi:hypothetical protein